MNKATIYISGVIGNDTTLLDVIRQFKSYDSPEEVEAIINSPGGNVDQGQSIYSYLRNLGLPITTIAEKAYSIAASIFMAGDIRVVNKGEKVLMVHLPWANKVSGTSKQLEAYSKELREIEKGFIDFYSLYLDLDKDTIKNLLESEIFMSSKEAIELGFAHKEEAPLKAVAQYTPENEKQKMNITDTLNLILKKLNIQPEIPIMALVLQDSAGTEINFTDLQEDESPEVGSKAEIDGEPAQGEFVMPSGQTYIFEGGELTEIKEAVSEEEGGEIVAEAQITEVSKWELSVVEETFDIGTQLHYQPSEEGEEPKAVSAGEYELEDGRKILTDSDGIIRYIKEADGQPATEDNQVEALLEKVEALYGKKLADQEAEIVALKKLIGTSEIEISAQEQQPKKRTNTYLR